VAPFGDVALARELLERNGAMRQREAGGPMAAAAWLADAFCG
jgi:hypothetical protein